MDSGTRICKKGLSLPGFRKTRPLECEPFWRFAIQELNFFFPPTDKWIEKHWVIICRILNKFVLRYLLKTEATYQASARSASLETPTCVLWEAMEATSQSAAAIAPCVLHVAARAALLIFLFLLQQNDERNLEHMEAFPHCKLFWGGKNVICKSCQTEEAFPNATTMFKHILGCQKCPADVLLCLLFLFKSSWLPPSRMKYQTLIPLVMAPGRQEDPLQLLFLYAQPPHSGLFHYPQATTWGTRLDTRKKKAARTPL